MCWRPVLCAAAGGERRCQGLCRRACRMHSAARRRALGGTYASCRWTRINAVLVIADQRADRSGRCGACSSWWSASVRGRSGAGTFTTCRTATRRTWPTCCNRHSRPNNVTAQPPARRTARSRCGGPARRRRWHPGRPRGAQGGGYGRRAGRRYRAGGAQCWRRRWWWHPGRSVRAVRPGSPPAQAPGGRAQQSQQLPAAAAPLAGPLVGGGQRALPAERLSIIPDPQNNALLVYGTGRRLRRSRRCCARSTSCRCR